MIEKKIIHDMILTDGGNLMRAEEQIEVKCKETLEAIEKLCLLDDVLMALVFDRNTEVSTASKMF